MGLGGWAHQQACCLSKFLGGPSEGLEGGGGGGGGGKGQMRDPWRAWPFKHSCGIFDLNAAGGGRCHHN
jgi:hypothetical protein